MKTVVTRFRRLFGVPIATAISMAAVFLSCAVMLLASASAANAAPLAGTAIGNQASATYTDASLVPRTATSNEVKTIILQVASVSLVNTQSKSVAAGGTVYFPHTVTNTGNGSDTFALAATGNAGTLTFTNIAVYPDANGDGVPDNFTAINTTGSLAAGTTFNFIVAATASGASVNGNSNTISVVATSGYTPAQTAANTDTATVSGNAIISMTKSVTPGSGNPGSGPLTYTLTYTNTGNATASSLVITDVIPAGLTYKPGGARWSVSGATVLTDAADGNQTFGAYTINYDAATVAGTVSATINQVLPGETRSLTFEVNVNAGAVPGIINNTATYSYNDNNGAGANQNGSSNPVPFTVNQAANVVANGSNATNGEADGDPITVASALQGSTVTFNAYIWNSGNGSDSFDITVTNGTFPAGTSFVLYKVDGVTPLVDTNGNSTPDTGVLSAGAFYNVIVKATLPASAVGGPFNATLTAASRFDSSKTSPASLVLSSITANSVDLTLTTARSDSAPAGTAVIGNTASTGFGDYINGSAALTPHNAANPGTTTVFTLKVNNTSSTADNYNLAAGTVEDFSTTPLPAGWTVSFKADGGVGDCSSFGAVIANTGVINNGANKTVCAIVSVPATAVAGVQNIYFRALSPTSAAADRIRTAVDVNTVRKIDVTTNQSGQVFPGGTVIYPMTVTNNGNVLEGSAPNAGAVDATNSFVAFSLADSQIAAGWTSVVYRDVNNDGAIDPGDTVIASLSSLGGLAPGASVPLLVKVFAPAGAGIGDINTTTLTATVTGALTIGVNPAAPAPAPTSATDTSTIISGQVTLTKLQSLDAACDGTADGAFVSTNINALPGACVIYQVTAKNVGTANISNLVISDATPAATVYNAGTDCPTTGGTHVAVSSGAEAVSTPSQCATGTISVTVPTLTPGATRILTFAVQINR